MNTRRALAFTLLSAMVIAFAAQWAVAEEQEELKLDLPKPVFTGTQKNVVSTNLDPNRDKPREPLMVPKGITNVAAEKPGPVPFCAFSAWHGAEADPRPDAESRKRGRR